MFRSIVVSIVVSTAAADLGAQALEGKPGESYLAAASSGAWTFFTDPRAIHHKGTSEKTYCGFIDRIGTVGIWSLDHASGKSDTATLHARLQVDDHDNPALYVRKDGRLAAYYQKHGNDRRVRYRVSTRPEDITAWGPEDSLVLPEGVTYSHLFRLSRENDRLYLFNRSIGWHPTVSASANDGTSWGSPAKLVGGPGGRPYIKYVSDGAARIHMAFTDGHPRDEATNSIYYAYYEGGSYYRADGTLIKAQAALPLAPVPDGERIYDGATAGRAWIWDIALDSAGRPALVYSVSPAETDHRYHYARWDGRQWRKGEMAKGGKWFPQTPAGQTEREPHYAGGIILDHEDPSVVFLSRPTNGVFEIERWETPDLGVTWRSRMITSGSAKNNVRPILPWSAPGRAQARKMLLWMHGDYVHYTNYSTSIRYLLWPEKPVPSAPDAQFPGRLHPSLRRLPGTLEVTLPGLRGNLRLAALDGRLLPALPAQTGAVYAFRTGEIPLGLYHLAWVDGSGKVQSLGRVILLP